MSKGTATVVFPVSIELDMLGDFDETRLNDEEYAEEIRERLKDMAADFLMTTSIKPIVTNASEHLSELVE